MKMFTQNDPLTDAELDRLADFLKSCRGGEAMNLEELDGFFAALIAAPETVMPSEYYPEISGGEIRILRVRHPPHLTREHRPVAILPRHRIRLASCPSSWKVRPLRTMEITHGNHPRSMRLARIFQCLAVPRQPLKLLETLES
jgi:hypothetical protein